MAKIVLGKRPESFKHVLKFQTPEGEEGMMEVRYKYRTLTEYGAFMDKWFSDKKAEVATEIAQEEDARKKAQEAGVPYVEPVRTNEDLRRIEANANADFLMLVMVGWNLDIEFSRESVLQLCDEFPGAVRAAMEDYRAAITEGRLGN